ncbi:MAG: radical SAM protein, partial [Acidimicrobiia bacterium]|nr:radical SAM protein [Acidimicrobiia bacterium]
MTGQPDPAGCYVHVPFCARVCPYCDFAVVAGRDELIDRYFEALLAEITMEPEAGPLGSVFVGGGTPSRVRPDLLTAVVAGLRDRFGLVDGAEVTLEANPEDWSPERAAQLARGGFSRVSFGAQSFDVGVLAELGRLHRAVELERLVDDSRAAGLASVSLDLIFGSWSESPESWHATVERAIAAGPDHVST